MKYPTAIKLILIPAAVVTALGLAVIISAQLFIMPWDKSKLPLLENPLIVVRKQARELTVFDGDKQVKIYKIALGSNPIGDKETEGDGKTPEGDFYIFTKNAESKFYLSIGVSYPGIEDAERGLENGLITADEHDQIVDAIKNKQTPPQKTSLGGEIYIHGFGNLTDWTEGCIALTNAEMRELFDAIPPGTPVQIKP